MDFKSFVKKALLTALTLAVCIPVIMMVTSVNASEGGIVDVTIQFFDAAGNEISSANPGDTITVQVTAVPKYSDGTPIDTSLINYSSFQISTVGFSQGLSQSLVNEYSFSGTVTLPDICYGPDLPICEVNGSAVYNINNPISADVPSSTQEVAISGTKTLTVPLTDRSEAPSNGDSGSSSGDSGSNGGSGSTSGDSGSSASSGSSDSAPAAGGGAAAPAVSGGAGGNAGTSTVSGVYTATSVNSVAITTPVATVAAAAGLSEADIAAGTNVRSYICDSRNREMKDALKAVAEASGRRIVSYINVDLYTITKAGVVTNIRNTATPVTMTFGLPGSLANAGHAYSIMCLNPDGTTAIFEDIDTNSATITINATAFGTYAIVINP